jgi:hypothetical protein
MSAPVILQGTLKPDGTLELDEKPNLPPGRVQVTMAALPVLPPQDPLGQMLEGIWEGQRQRGHVPRSVEEVEAERRKVREEWDQRMATILRTQEEARRLRERSA